MARFWSSDSTCDRQHSCAKKPVYQRFIKKNSAAETWKKNKHKKSSFPGRLSHVIKSNTAIDTRTPDRRGWALFCLAQTHPPTFWGEGKPPPTTLPGAVGSTPPPPWRLLKENSFGTERAEKKMTSYHQDGDGRPPHSPRWGCMDSRTAGASPPHPDQKHPKSTQNTQFFFRKTQPLAPLG